jgi:hypothetical protein
MPPSTKRHPLFADHLVQAESYLQKTRLLLSTAGFEKGLAWRADMAQRAATTVAGAQHIVELLVRASEAVADVDARANLYCASGAALDAARMAVEQIETLVALQGRADAAQPN